MYIYFYFLLTCKCYIIIYKVHMCVHNIKASPLSLSMFLSCMTLMALKSRLKAATFTEDLWPVPKWVPVSSGCVIISDCWTHSDGLDLMCEKSNTVLRLRHRFWQLNAFRWIGSEMWNPILRLCHHFWQLNAFRWIGSEMWNPILILHHHFLQLKAFR